MAIGKDHRETLKTLFCMGTASQIKGEYDIALAWYQRALYGRERVLGKGHPSTIEAANIVAALNDFMC